MSSTPNNSQLIIRQANIGDCPLILRFIKELADYEKLLHEVVADVPTLEESLFGEKQHAEVVIAEYQGEPVGFALFFHNFSTFLGRPGLYLEDLYIQNQCIFFPWMGIMKFQSYHFPSLLFAH